MLSWFSGPRAAEAPPDLDASYIEPPETPAPVFAVKAFKHALFGTPQPAAKMRVSCINNQAKVEEASEQDSDKPASDQEDKAAQRKRLRRRSAPDSSPTKPASILMTPGGNAASRRKTVSFGAQVVDNEGKKATRSGIPSNCPGKFPSPWTPKLSATSSEARAHTGLTEKLFSARSKSTPSLGFPALESLPESHEKPRARDDADITINILDPRSESGRYWKTQYTEYAERSERHVKKLVAKQQLAKSYAKKKDDEARELANKLAEEKGQHKVREKELETQVKDLQERLRLTLGENAKMGMEMAALRRKLENLEARPEKKAAKEEPVESILLEEAQAHSSDLWGSLEPALRLGDGKPTNVRRRANKEPSTSGRVDRPATKLILPEKEQNALKPLENQSSSSLRNARTAAKSSSPTNHQEPIVPASSPFIEYAPVTRDAPIIQQSPPPLQLQSQSTRNSKASLPPDRLAAAKAAIERRRLAKENVRP